MAETQDRHGIGGNNPPPDALEDVLAERYADLEDDILALAIRARKVQDVDIATDDAALIVGAILKDASALSDKVEKARKSEKEPHLKAGQDVDAFFHQWVRDHKTDRSKIGRLTRIQRVLGARLDRYQTSKAAHARARQAAEEEAARLKARAAEKAAAEAEERARQSEARRAVQNGELNLSGADDPFAELKAMRERVTAARAAHADAALPQSTPDAVRVHGDGVMISGTDEWVFEIEDMSLVDLTALRPHFTRAAIASAIRAFVQDGGRALDGVRIYTQTRAIVR